MQVKIDEAARVVEIDGQKFAFDFFKFLSAPDEDWLYAFQRSDDVLTIKKVVKIPDGIHATICWFKRPDGQLGGAH